MLGMITALPFLLAVALASAGNILPEYRTCYTECVYQLCYDYFPPSIKYSKEFLESTFSLNPLYKVLWPCTADCNYKCQQIITAIRLNQGLPMVQFFGKWPFLRVFFFQEFYASILSFGNFKVNYSNFFIVYNYYINNRDRETREKRSWFNEFNDLFTFNDTPYCNISKQYLQAIIMSLFGWMFSTIYHVRDVPLTESLDYFGAFGIVLLNFNVISYRFLKIYSYSPLVQSLWKLALFLTYICHFIKLTAFKWDYKYNLIVNSTFGMTGTIMWFIHSYNIWRKCKKHKLAINNSLQLSPFESKILKKFNIGGSSWIPIYPVFFNAWLLFGVSFEFYDFSPIHQLIDGHALWHLATIIPAVVWYDWNMWDIELLKITDGLENKETK